MNYKNLEQANGIIETQAKQLNQLRESLKPFKDFKQMVEKKLCNGNPCDFDSLNMEQLKQMNEDVNSIVDSINDF